VSGIVLGVDPGSLHTGFGVILAEADRLTHVAHGQIAMASRIPLEARLCQIYDRLRELIREHQPHTLALEEIFLANNVKSAFILGQVRGVVLLAAAKTSLPVHLYSPLVVKKAVVGYGGAVKSQVKLMVEHLLGVKINNHHAADALAVGVCHLFHSRTLKYYS
jgi:crossover junction endodeoxyribonuclease RuvC